jgi:hypothetical protein
MNTKPRQQPASGASSHHYTLTSNDAVVLTPNVAHSPGVVAISGRWTSAFAQVSG